MEKDMEKLFQLYLRSEEYMEGRRSEEEGKREYQLFVGLFEDMSDEKNKLLNEYILLLAKRQYENIKRAYKAGYKEACRQIKKEIPF